MVKNLFFSSLGNNPNPKSDCNAKQDKQYNKMKDAILACLLNADE